MREGKKGILFAKHTAVIDKLMQRYAHFNPLRFDGKVKGNAPHRISFDEQGMIVMDHNNGEMIKLSAYNRLLFQQHPDYKLFIANNKS